MSNRIHMRAVERAAQIADGEVRLAMYLEVSPFLVNAWLLGKSAVPPAMLDKIVDILIDYSARPRGAIPPTLVDAFKHQKAANG